VSSGIGQLAKKAQNTTGRLAIHDKLLQVKHSSFLKAKLRDQDMSYSALVEGATKHRPNQKNHPITDHTPLHAIALLLVIVETNRVGNLQATAALEDHTAN